LKSEKFSLLCGLVLVVLVGVAGLSLPMQTSRAANDPAFESDPASGPKGTPVFLSGSCKNAGGRPGRTIPVTLDRASDHTIVAQRSFSVNTIGDWRGSMTIPKTDPKGREVSVGNYLIGADCEFDEDSPDDFSYADQPFAVTAGEAAGCGPGDPSCGDEVDCVANPALCQGGFSGSEIKAALTNPAKAAAAAKAKGASPSPGASVSPGPAGDTAVSPPAAPDPSGKITGREAGGRVESAGRLGRRNRAAAGRKGLLAVAIVLLLSGAGAGYMVLKRRHAIKS